MKKLLKKLFFVAILSLTFATVQAQDPDAFVHLRFENNLTATGTSGLAFSLVDNLNGTANLAYLSPGKEGSSTLDFGAIDASADPADPNVPIIQNNDQVGIQSTTNSGIVGNDARSITAWVRFDDDLTTSNGNYCVANLGPGSPGDRGRFNFIVDSNNGRLSVILTNGRANATLPGSSNLERRANLMDVVTPANSPWHHVAVTYPTNGTLADMAFYLDGVLYATTIATAATTDVLVTEASPMSVAMDMNFQSKWFDGGSLDDLRVYDFGLTQAQVINTMNGSNALLSTGDIAFGENEIKAFPNAVDDILQIQTTSNNALQINVFDITGKAIIRTYGKSVDMSGLTSGMYIVKVREDNKVANLKILKN